MNFLYNFKNYFLVYLIYICFFAVPFFSQGKVEKSKIIKNSPKLKQCWTESFENEGIIDYASDKDNVYILTDKFTYSKQINQELNWKIQNIEDNPKKFFLFQDLLITLSHTPEPINEINLEAFSIRSGLIKWKKKLSADLKECFINGIETGDFKFYENINNFGLGVGSCKISFSNKGNLENKQNIGFVDHNTGNLQENLIDNNKSIFSKIDNAVYKYDDFGVITKFKSKGDISWKLKIGGSISNIGHSENRLFISSADNYVYSIKKSNGNIIWKKRFSGKTFAVKSISGEFLFVVVTGEPNVYLINTEQGKIIDRFAVSENLNFIEKFIQVGNITIFQAENTLYAFSSDSNC